MDVNRFDQMARQVSHGNRRTFGRTLGWLALFGGGSSAFPPFDGDAKRKGKGKGKKKTCKGGTKKCGKRCISADQCCTTDECAPTFGCINGVCQCDTSWRLCGDRCVHNGSCCTTADCSRMSLYCANDVCNCENDGCYCRGVSAEGTCCKMGEVFNVSTRTCQPGPCPSVSNCSNFYLCGTAALPGLCASSASGTAVCVDDADDSRICMSCSTDAACVATMGAGAVCVNPGGCRCGFSTTSYCARTIPQ